MYAGLDPWEVVTVVNEMRYKDSYLDASWALGSAIEAVSSLPKFERFMQVMWADFCVSHEVLNKKVGYLSFASILPLRKSEVPVMDMLNAPI